MGKLLGYAFLAAVICYMINKIQGFITKKVKEYSEHSEQLARIKKQKADIQRASTKPAVNNYALCLSIDIGSRRPVSMENKLTICKVVFSKLTKIISMVIPDLIINEMQNVLII